MITSFWLHEPTILLSNRELWPTSQMSFEAKLNAMSRLILLLTILGFALTGNWTLLFVGLATLALLCGVYKWRKKQMLQEHFSVNPAVTAATTATVANKTTTNPVTLETVLRSEFHPTTKQNPFGNVLLTDIGDHPDRKAAAPSFNPDVYDDIDSAVKKQTQMLNPSIVNTNKQLYGDLYDNYTLDKSMMRFYSTANTRVANDQGAFSKFLYGNMPSGKSSGPDGAFARVQDNYRYILI